jgi:hypothetical protein
VETSDWRHYRRHLIVARRRGLFGLRRFEVWDRGNLLGTFRDVVRAELHIDARLESD